MNEIIKNIIVVDDNGTLEGTFTSEIFPNDDTQEMTIYIHNKSLMNYAKKCINHFNSMPDSMIDEICRRIIKNLKFIGADFELSEFENVRDILNYCWFTAMAVDIPENEEISYLIEGEGEWGEIVGIVVKNGSISYVGDNYYSYI